MTLVEIVKPIQGDRLYKSGEIVDATGWRNTNALLRLGRIRRYIPPEQLAQTVVQGGKQPSKRG